MTWQPNSWRDHPIKQVPDYPDAEKLAGVEARLAAMPPSIDGGGPPPPGNSATPHVKP